MSVEIIFGATDVFNLPDKLDNRCMLYPDCIPSFLLKRLTAPLALPLHILFVLLHQFEKTLMLFLTLKMAQNQLLVTINLLFNR